MNTRPQPRMPRQPRKNVNNSQSQKLTTDDNPTLTTDDQEKLVKDTTFGGKNSPQVDQSPEQIIQETISMIQSPFTVMRDAQGVIHTMMTISVKCARGHPHAIPISDIRRCGRVTVCPSCSGGNTFTRFVRELFEQALEVPFAIILEPMSGYPNVTEYTNPPLAVIVVCHHKDIPPSTHEYRNNILYIHIPKTASKQKVGDIIYASIKDYARLNDKQRATINSHAKSVDNHTLRTVKIPPVFIPRPLPRDTQMITRDDIVIPIKKYNPFM